MKKIIFIFLTLILCSCVSQETYQYLHQDRTFKVQRNVCKQTIQLGSPTNGVSIDEVDTSVKNCQYNMPIGKMLFLGVVTPGTHYHIYNVHWADGNYNYDIMIDSGPLKGTAATIADGPRPTF